MHRENSQGCAPITDERIEEILSEEKPNQRERILLFREDYGRFFPVNCSERQIRADIIAGLELLRRQRMRERAGSAR